MIEQFVHPVVYGKVEATEENLAAAVEDGFVYVAALKRDIADVMGRMEPLRERLAEMRGPAKLPRPSRRTEVQSKVASCPRCGGSLGSSTSELSVNAAGLGLGVGGAA